MTTRIFLITLLTAIALALAVGGLIGYQWKASKTETVTVPDTNKTKINVDSLREVWILPIKQEKIQLQILKRRDSLKFAEIYNKLSDSIKSFWNDSAMVEPFMAEVTKSVGVKIYDTEGKVLDSTNTDISVSVTAIGYPLFIFPDIFAQISPIQSNIIRDKEILKTTEYIKKKEWLWVNNRLGWHSGKGTFGIDLGMYCFGVGIMAIHKDKPMWTGVLHYGF